MQRWEKLTMGLLGLFIIVAMGGCFLAFLVYVLFGDDEE